MFPKKKNNEDDFVDARVDERCLCLAWKYSSMIQYCIAVL